MATEGFLHLMLHQLRNALFNSAMSYQSQFTFVHVLYVFVFISAFSLLVCARELRGEKSAASVKTLYYPSNHQCFQ